MGKIVRNVYYFDEPGEQNTEDVIERVLKCINETNIKTIIVASTSGKTALKFAEALSNKKTNLICVSEPPSRRLWGGDWPSLKLQIKKRLEKLGVAIVDRVPYKFHDSVLTFAKWYTPLPEHIVGDTFAFVGGQGLKVAVEAMFMAVQAGCIEPGNEVISVGGYGSGADTAIIVKTSFPETLFSPEVEKRLEIREILAMPRYKKWWDADKKSCLK